MYATFLISMFTTTGQVMLDSMHPSEPPDFIFNSHDFGFMPDIEDIKVSKITEDVDQHHP